MRRLLPVRPVFMAFVAALILSVASAGAAFAHGPVSDGQSRSDDGPRGNFGDFLEYDGETVKKQSEKIDYDTHEIREYIQNVLSDLSGDPETARERLRKFGSAAQGLVDYLVILDDFMESEGESAPSNVSISSNITLNIAVLMNEDHPDNSIYRYYLVDQFLYSSSFLRIDQRGKHMIVYNHIHRKKNIGVDLTDGVLSRIEKRLFEFSVFGELNGKGGIKLRKVSDCQGQSTVGCGEKPIKDSTIAERMSGIRMPTIDPVQLMWISSRLVR